ncbi:MAG: hypothetical protein C5B55_05795 [Blastocatellia bacterium]|nr:MAG: hypothetical protein C5B55_05795 [Blastocatellia bacterium]
MEAQKATDVCRKFYLGDVGKKLLSGEQTTDQFVELLVQNKQYIDAIRVLAYALPTKTAIAWANRCARQFLQESPDESSAAAEAVDKWLAEPNEENRRAAMKAAETATFSTPAGSAALAVFLSGGSIAPPDAPETNPQDDMAPNAVVGSVMLAAVLKEPEKAEARFQSFVADGRSLASSK